jgi:hypothetical protein
MLGAKGDDDPAEYHVDRGGEEGGSDEDKYGLEAEGRYRLLIAVGYDSGSVPNGFNCEGQLRSVHLSASINRKHVQIPPTAKGMKYQARAFLSRQIWRQDRIAKMMAAMMAAGNDGVYLNSLKSGLLPARVSFLEKMSMSGREVD